MHKWFRPAALLVGGLFLLPEAASAHIVAAPEDQGFPWFTLAMLPFTAAFAVCLGLYLRYEKRGRKREAKRMKTGSIAAIVILAGIAGLSALQSGGPPPSKLDMLHVHGVGFTADGASIVVPVHTGLMQYRGGMWWQGAGKPHDYMGFSMVDDGFYSSGHPAPGSGMKEPLGIVKSSDGGKTLQTLALAGEADFHQMTAGYRTHVLYAYNTAANSLMPEIGLYVSTDEGKTWRHQALAGMDAEPLAMAAHPDDPHTVAFGTEQGLYISRDQGAHAAQIVHSMIVTAVAFGSGGDLLAAVQPIDGSGPVKMIHYTARGEQDAAVVIAGLEAMDRVLYAAVNPVRPAEWVAATMKRSLFLTEDSGKTWSLIAKDGKGIELHNHP